MLSELVKIHTVTRKRPKATTQQTRLGDTISAGFDLQVIQGRLFEKYGRPKFGQQGRTDDSTHSLLYDIAQVFYNTPGNPFTDVVRYDADVKLGDKIDFENNSYRVDNVIDIAGEGDHIECRLTLCLPGGE